MRPSPVKTTVAPRIGGVEAESVQHQVDSGDDRSAAGREPRAEPPRRAPPGQVVDVQAGVAPEDVGEAPEVRVEDRATISGVAPFCGPNTALAPWGPWSGFVTSLATRIATVRRRGSRAAGRSARGRPGPRRRGRSAARLVQERAPRAWSAPAPASLVALPPIGHDEASRPGRGRP